MPVRVFRATYPAKPPSHAERLTRGGRTILRWTGRHGRRIEGVLNPATGAVIVEVNDVWYFEFTDHTGKKRKRKGLADKASTEALARDHQTKADRVRAGLDAPVKADQAVRSLREHLKDFIAFLESKRRNPDYVRSVEHRVGAILTGTRAKSAGDLTDGAVTVYLGKLRKDDDKKRGIGPATVAGYVAGVRAFLAWCKKEGKTPINPLAETTVEKDKTDVRRKRRRLKDDEFGRLVAAAEQSKLSKVRDNAKPFGEARAVLYVVAAYTGLRAEELGNLTPEDFYLDDTPPHVVLPAEHSKRGQEDVIPIPTSAVPRIRSFVSRVPAGRHLWPGKWWQRAYELVQVDLAACDPPIPYRDARGRQADFHSLRRTYISRLAAAKVDVKTAQKLARHSSAVLTLDVYMDEAEMDEMARAADRLPAPPESSEPRD